MKMCKCSLFRQYQILEMKICSAKRGKLSVHWLRNWRVFMNFPCAWVCTVTFSALCVCVCVCACVRVCVCVYMHGLCWHEGLYIPVCVQVFVCTYIWCICMLFGGGVYTIVLMSMSLSVFGRLYKCCFCYPDYDGAIMCVLGPTFSQRRWFQSCCLCCVQRKWHHLNTLKTSRLCSDSLLKFWILFSDLMSSRLAAAVFFSSFTKLSWACHIKQNKQKKIGCQLYESWQLFFAQKMGQIQLSAFI